jgi:hypothetical protein
MARLITKAVVAWCLNLEHRSNAIAVIRLPGKSKTILARTKRLFHFYLNMMPAWPRQLFSLMDIYGFTETLSLSTRILFY